MSSATAWVTRVKKLSVATSTSGPSRNKERLFFMVGLDLRTPRRIGGFDLNFDRTERPMQIRRINRHILRHTGHTGESKRLIPARSGAVKRNLIKTRAKAIMLRVATITGRLPNRSLSAPP